MNRKTGPFKDVFDDRIDDLFVEMINSKRAFETTAEPVAAFISPANAVVTVYNRDADGAEYTRIEWATVQPCVEPKPLLFLEPGRVREVDPATGKYA